MPLVFAVMVRVTSPNSRSRHSPRANVLSPEGSTKSNRLHRAGARLENCHLAVSS